MEERDIERIQYVEICKGGATACHVAPFYCMTERVQPTRQTGASGRSQDLEREGGWIRDDTWHLLVG